MMWTRVEKAHAGRSAEERSRDRRMDRVHGYRAIGLDRRGFNIAAW
jgi:hypothetical protein